MEIGFGTGSDRCELWSRNATVNASAGIRLLQLYLLRASTPNQSLISNLLLSKRQQHISGRAAEQTVTGLNEEVAIRRHNRGGIDRAAGGRYAVHCRERLGGIELEQEFAGACIDGS